MNYFGDLHIFYFPNFTKYIHSPWYNVWMADEESIWSICVVCKFVGVKAVYFSSVWPLIYSGLIIFYLGSDYPVL